MRRSMRRLALAVGLFGLLSEAATARPQSVPMKGTVAGVATIEYGSITQDASGNLIIPVESTATGQLSHLGRVALTESHTTEILASTGYQTTVVLDGEATVTAANGDQLFLSFMGAGVRTINGFNDTFLYEVVGGTGRFAGASGTGPILSSDKGVSAPFVDGRGHLVETSPFVFDLSGVLIKGS
jgi:hypothetical protein